jgi:hypothetical protein
VHFSTGVFKPFLMDSRIPGIDTRDNVSSMARQSSSDIKTGRIPFPDDLNRYMRIFHFVNKSIEALSSLPFAVNVVIFLTSIHVRYMVRYHPISVKHFYTGLGPPVK